jgi:cytochrome c biogenesis protein CcmG/thiol:disulfide interchange protein DsbE
MRIPRPRRYLIAAALFVVVALFLAACGGDERVEGTPDSGAAQPSSQVPTEGLPPALARNVKQGDQIVGKGKDAFAEQLRKLRGHPVVVNQWASWCPNCRFEFPFFANAAKRHRDEVAFVGLDSQDDQGSAEAFLEEFPVGFPSVFDPDAEVAAAYGGGQAWPTTMFFDRTGELVHVKIGAYAAAGLLEQDIERWALGRGS